MLAGSTSHSQFNARVRVCVCVCVKDCTVGQARRRTLPPVLLDEAPFEKAVFGSLNSLQGPKVPQKLQVPKISCLWSQKPVPLIVCAAHSRNCVGSSGFYSQGLKAHKSYVFLDQGLKDLFK